MRWWLSVMLVFLASTLNAACGSTPSGSPAQPLYNQFDRDWQYWMAQYPEVAGSLGVPGGESRWTDYSRDAISARATYVRESLDRIKFVDRAVLDDRDERWRDFASVRRLMTPALRRSV